MAINLFKSFTLTWWQVGLFKIGMLAVGIIIGAFWSDFFAKYWGVLIAIAAATLLYVTYVWTTQIARPSNSA